jgi:hypothetical protein
MKIRSFTQKDKLNDDTLAFFLANKHIRVLQMFY